MKHSQTSTIRHHLLPGITGALSLFLVSCKLPPREAWNQVQQHGLIPVLMASNPAPAPNLLPRQVTAGQPVATPIPPVEAAPLKVQAVQQPEIAKIPFATPVPGRAGYVFSPHTEGRKLVDVRQYAAGAEVRCPYTMLPFNVPDFSAIAAAEPAPRPKPQHSVAEVASRTTESTSEQIPMIIPDLPPPPAQTSHPAQTEIPYGSRVPGRAGFVYSPFADKNQLVDVAGIAPGVEVKCPYTNKLFPRSRAFSRGNGSRPGHCDSPAETAPGTRSDHHPSCPGGQRGPDRLLVRQGKESVQSPFGSAGQLVDVTGRAAGSKMSCPFTNKEFIIPAH